MVVRVGVIVGVEVIVAVKVMVGEGEAVGVASLDGVGASAGAWVGVLCGARGWDGIGDGVTPIETRLPHPLSRMTNTTHIKVIIVRR